MKISDRYEFLMAVVYCYYNELTDDERGSYGGEGYNAVMDDLLFLRGAEVIDSEIFRIMWQNAGVTTELAAEYTDLVLSGHAIEDVDDKLRVCIEVMKSGGKLTLAAADEISRLEGVTIKGELHAKYLVFDDIDNKNGAAFGLEFMYHIETDVIEAGDEAFNEPSTDTRFVIPKDYTLMQYIHLLHNQTQFLDKFAEEYKAGKAVTANICEEYEDFLKRMNAVFRITLYSRVKRVFKTPKQWECTASHENTEIRLDSISENRKSQIQAALLKFTEQNAVKSGQILQIAVDGENGAYRYMTDGEKSDFMPLGEFYHMPVDPDKIWAVLSKFRLVSSYAEKLPIEIAEKLSDEEQFYAKRMIAWQAENSTDKSPVARTSTLSERLSYLQDSNVMAMMKTTKALGKMGKKPTAKLEG
jgi:hypothetical protein